MTGIVGVKDEIGNLNGNNEPYDCSSDTLDEVRSLTEIKDIEQKDVCLIDLMNTYLWEPRSWIF